MSNCYMTMIFHRGIATFLFFDAIYVIALCILSLFSVITHSLLKHIFLMCVQQFFVLQHPFS